MLGLRLLEESMSLLCRLGSSFLLCVAASLLCSVPAVSQTAGCTAEAARAATLRDGQHNFDFDLGPLKLHLSRLQQPRTGSSQWSGLDGTELDGTVVVPILWPGIIPDAHRFDAHHFEQSYPDGGGETWEPKFFADLTVADVTVANVARAES
jgi:hypothetical protein